MLFLRKYRLISLALLLGLLACGNSLRDSEVVATVSAHKIKVGEIKKSLRQEREHYSQRSYEHPDRFYEIKQKILNEKIERHLLLKEAKKLGIKLKEEEITRELKQFKNQYTEFNFQKMLEELGVHYQDWFKTKRENLIIKKLFLSLVELKEGISEDSLKAYYLANQNEFTIPESVRIRQIVTDTQEKAESIVRRLKNGENFAKLARDLSISPDRKQGGDVGLVRRGSFPREFEVCFSMNPGEISPIIPSLYGFHLFKVIEKFSEEVREFEEVKGKIRLLLKQRARQRARQMLLDRLKQEAVIEINEEKLKMITL